MSLSKFDICSNALVMIGANPISDFAGDTTESVVAAQLWETTMRAWLTMYDWRFATLQVQLSLVAETPLAGWSYSYQVPSGLLKLRNITCNDTPITFNRFQDRIYANYSSSEVLIAEHTVEVEAAYWPPYFTSVMEYELAAKFCTSLGQRTLSVDQKAERDRLFKFAKTADAQQNPARKINLRHSNSLIGRR